MPAGTILQEPPAPTSARPPTDAGIDGKVAELLPKTPAVSLLDHLSFYKQEIPGERTLVAAYTIDSSNSYTPLDARRGAWTWYGVDPGRVHDPTLTKIEPMDYLYLSSIV